MHADIVVLIQKLSKSIRRIILSLIWYNVAYPSTYSTDHYFNGTLHRLLYYYIASIIFSTKEIMLDETSQSYFSKLAS